MIMISLSHMSVLDRSIKEKVLPAFDRAVQKSLGFTISRLGVDISDILRNKLIGFIIRTDLSFKESKKNFKQQFLKKAIQTHFGNVSEVADLVGLDRRSVHRDIKDLKIDIKVLRSKLYKPSYFKKETLDKVFKSALSGYKSVIRPEKLESLYDEVPKLSEDLADELPEVQMTWKEAEREFEIFYLSKVLKDNNFEILKTSRQIKIRYETLLRKMKKFNLKR